MLCCGGRKSFQTDITNDNNAVYIADTQIIGDYLNNGTTTVQNGTLTIIGTLTNNGTIIGDVSRKGGGRGSRGERSTAGLTVLGDYALDAGASLLMPGPGLVVKVAGDFDCAVDSNDR